MFTPCSPFPLSHAIHSGEKDLQVTVNINLVTKDKMHFPLKHISLSLVGFNFCSKLKQLNEESFFIQTELLTFLNK